MKTYTTQEIAGMLQLSRQTIYGLARTGQIQAVKIGREWRITEEALNHFMKDGTGEQKADNLNNG